MKPCNLDVKYMNSLNRQLWAKWNWNPLILDELTEVKVKSQSMRFERLKWTMTFLKKMLGYSNATKTSSQSFCNSSTWSKPRNDFLLTSGSSLRWSHSSSFSSARLAIVLSSISLSLLSLDAPPPELMTKGALTFLYYFYLHTKIQTLLYYQQYFSF